MQNLLFVAFEQLIDARVKAAIVAGTYDLGVETFRVAERGTVYTHPATSAETRCNRVVRGDRNRPMLLADALALAKDAGVQLIDQ